MAFFMPPGEHMRKELRLDLGGGMLSALPFMFRASKTIRITNRRLVLTESYKRGNEITTYVPLEAIIQVRQGRYSSTRWLYAAVVFFVLALIALPFTLGLFSLPPAIIGAIMLLLYFGSRAESLVVEAGTQHPIILSTGKKEVSHVEDLDGNRLSLDELDTLHEELEAARQGTARKDTEAEED